MEIIKKFKKLDEQDDPVKIDFNKKKRINDLLIKYDQKFKIE